MGSRAGGLEDSDATGEIVGYVTSRGSRVRGAESPLDPGPPRRGSLRIQVPVWWSCGPATGTLPQVLLPPDDLSSMESPRTATTACPAQSPFPPQPPWALAGWLAGCPSDRTPPCVYPSMYAVAFSLFFFFYIEFFFAPSVDRSPLRVLLTARVNREGHSRTRYGSSSQVDLQAPTRTFISAPPKVYLIDAHSVVASPLARPCPFPPAISRTLTVMAAPRSSQPSASL